MLVLKDIESTKAINIQNWVGFQPGILQMK